MGNSVDCMHRDGAMCSLSDMLMGATAEILASEHPISRQKQDEYALNSHRKTVAATESEAFAAQVLAVHRVMLFDMDKCNISGGAIALLSCQPESY
ncbi:MAG: hypothetical protein CSA35_06310 [Dethiosulfovibrio peptidovorans]|nr:MAG: hypothetical protein CSA35_06310 [Dethiosulfovibrio peptidovorans]